jgi:trehalose monomycolate/heme transporter
MPVATNRTGDNASDPADPTAAIPVMRPEDNDSDAATEKLNARGQGENGDKTRQRRRAGGGLSAQDLLRREGRL